MVPPSALILVLVSAAVHAGWNRLLHDTDDRIPAMAVAGFTTFVLLLPALAITPPTRVAPLVVLSGVAQAAYALCLTAAYARGALSLAYPIGRGTAPLLVTLGGWVVLAQRPSGLALLGALCLGLGLLTVATGSAADGRRQAVIFALLTGCCIAAYSLIDARAVGETAPAGYLGPVMGLMALILTFRLRGRLSRLRRALRPGIAIGIGTTAAYLLVLFAFQGAHAGRVATVRESSVLIGLLLARDRPGLQTWAGAALVVGGAVLAAL
jgi:drug/metabolite transporter (DMT)-like permease